MKTTSSDVFESLVWCGNTAVNLNRDLKKVEEPIIADKDKFTITLSYNSFSRPSTLNKDCLNIALDHSFAFESDDNIVFIDHHLVEQMKNVHYPSNAQLLYDNYQIIYKVLERLITSYDFGYCISIWYHEDLDGLMSAIICKKIINDIFQSKIDNAFKYKLNLIKIAGNYGDIYQDAKLDLIATVGNKESVNIYDKKMSGLQKAFSRFMKAVRNIIYVSDETSIKQINNFLSRINVTHSDIIMTFNTLHNLILSLNDIDIKTSIIIFNWISQNYVINSLVKCYNSEIERIISSFVSPQKNEGVSSEIFVRHRKDETHTTYRLLFIDSLFDMNRSIIWKYRSSLNSLRKVSSTPSLWQYKVTDWIKQNTTLSNTVLNTDNIMCYNITTQKLSLDSENGSAFAIASFYDGGGHADIENKRSIGSVKIENLQQFLDDCVMVELI